MSKQNDASPCYHCVINQKKYPSYLQVGCQGLWKLTHWPPSRELDVIAGRIVTTPSQTVTARNANHEFVVCNHQLAERPKVMYMYIHICIYAYIHIYRERKRERERESERERERESVRVSEWERERERESERERERERVLTYYTLLIRERERVLTYYTLLIRERESLDIVYLAYSPSKILRKRIIHRIMCSKYDSCTPPLFKPWRILTVGDMMHDEVKHAQIIL